MSSPSSAGCAGDDHTCGFGIRHRNRPGADGVIAADNFVKSRAGAALLFSSSGLYTAAPLMFAPLPYDTAADLIPISAAVTAFLEFIVPPTSPVRSMSGLFDRMREQPGRTTWAAPGAYLCLVPGPDTGSRPTQASSRNLACKGFGSFANQASSSPGFGRI